MNSLDTSTLGIFGAGHLGRAIAIGLLESGFPKSKLLICHKGSIDTYNKLVDAGLSDYVVTPDKVVKMANILLYTVRPQNYLSLTEYIIPEKTLFISFMAGIELRSIPIDLPKKQRVRIMPSSPDTILKKNGIAAIYPKNSISGINLLTDLKLKVFPLDDESDIHAFTALGPCLPFAITYFETLGKEVDNIELLNIGEKYNMPEYFKIIEWARNTQPHNFSSDELDQYVKQASTPGGVTEAILNEIRNGKSLSVSLEKGIYRSKELSKSK
jgi:pyrroline-5-carboxylate reductase